MTASENGRTRRWPWLLLALLLLLLLAGGLLWGSLSRGISVESVSIGPVELGQIALSLDGKLSLSIGRLVVDEHSGQRKASGGTKLEPKHLRRILKLIRYSALMFQDLVIRDVQVGAASGQFRYHDLEPGYLTLASDKIALDIGIDGTEDEVLIDLVRLEGLEGDIQVSGKARMDVANQRVHAELEGLLGRTLPVSVLLDVDTEMLSFEGRGLEAVTSIVPIVEMFQLGPAITPWIAEYLEGSEFRLLNVSGELLFDDPASILQTLVATAVIEDVAYTFAQGVDPVRAPEVLVEFSNGVLDIRPEQPTFYGHDGKDSNVNINFNDQRFPLTANIRAQAPASGGILTLLHHYHIPFPFEQVDGVADIDLTLGILLKTIARDVRGSLDVDGRFLAQDSVIDFAGQRFEVADLNIELENTTALTFNRLELTGPEGPAIQLAGNLTGQFDPLLKTGELTLALERFQWPARQPQLILQASAAERASVALQFNPDGNTLILPASAWMYGKRRIAIDALETPIDLKTLAGQLPPTLVDVSGALRARVQGEYNVKALTTDFTVDLLKLSAGGLRLAQQQAPLSLRVNKGVQLVSLKPMKLELKGQALVLRPSRVGMAGGVLNIEQSGLQIGQGISTALTGTIDNGAGSGRLVLRDLERRNDSGLVTFAAEAVALQLARGDGGLQLSSPELGVQVLIGSDGGWTLDCPDFAKLHRYSSLMQRELLKEGEFHLALPAKAERYEFHGRLKYPYELLVQDDTPTGDFHFSGWYNGVNTHLTINDVVEIDLGKTIRVTSQGIGYNLAEMKRLAKDAQAAADKTNAASGSAPPVEDATPSTAEGTRRINIRARDTFLRLDDTHRLLANSLLFHVAEGRVKVNLQYGPGLATLLLEGSGIQLAGKNFDQHFILALMPELGDLDGGLLEFRVDGTLDQIEAALAIRNTVIKDFKTLNNMLAFLNTLPGLLTFKPAQYDNQGLPARELAVGFTLSGGVMDLTSMLIESEELSVRGKGSLDFNDSTIDATFNLITGMKKSISKIPLLGFILEGDEKKTAIALKVTGDLHDPEVKSTAFKEVASYPFKVIARTILLPVHLIKSAQGGTDDEAVTKEATP